MINAEEQKIDAQTAAVARLRARANKENEFNRRLNVLNKAAKREADLKSRKRCIKQIIVNGRCDIGASNLFLDQMKKDYDSMKKMLDGTAVRDRDRYIKIEEKTLVRARVWQPTRNGTPPQARRRHFLFPLFAT